MLLTFATIRAFRGHFGPDGEGPPRRRGARHLLALRRHHVDHRLRDGLHPLARTLQTGAVLGRSVTHMRSLRPPTCGSRPDRSVKLNEAAVFKWVVIVGIAWRVGGRGDAADAAAGGGAAWAGARDRGLRLWLSVDGDRNGAELAQRILLLRQKVAFGSVVWQHADDEESWTDERLDDRKRDGRTLRAARGSTSGFAQVDERFDEVDERFAQVDKRFEQVDSASTSRSAPQQMRQAFDRLDGGSRDRSTLRAD